MEFGTIVNDARLRVAALVGVCFLLGSTGWLSWLRQIMEFADPTQTDLFTMVAGYLAQAAGTGIFMLVARRFSVRAMNRAAIASVVAYAVLIEPATMASNLAGILAFGWIANVFFGVAQGYYLYCLASLVEQGNRGMVFGGGYAASTVASWLLSAFSSRVSPPTGTVGTHWHAALHRWRFPSSCSR